MKTPSFSPVLCLCASVLSCCVVASNADAGYITVYRNDFDSGLFAANGVTDIFSGITTTQSVNGLAGIGTGSNVFSGIFLRNTTGGAPGTPVRLPGIPGQSTVLTLTNLAAHTSIDICFLFAAIDTWHGETALGGGVIGGGFPAVFPDYLNVTIDGDTSLSWVCRAHDWSVSDTECSIAVKGRGPCPEPRVLKALSSTDSI